MTHLILSAVIWLFASGALASQVCGNNVKSTSVFLTENTLYIPILSRKNLVFFDWSEGVKAAQNLNFEINPTTDSLLYTTTVLNFLEFSSLDYFNGTPNKVGSILETRLGLFFLQVNQSPNIRSLWTELVKELIHEEEYQVYLGISPASSILKYFNHVQSQQRFLRNLANLIVRLGEKLHIQFQSDKQVQFSKINDIILSPSNQFQNWQTLLQQLVHWQFDISLQHLDSIYCEALKDDFQSLVIKIPPTPLLEFYLFEFEKWGKKNGIAVDFNI